MTPRRPLTGLSMFAVFAMASLATSSAQTSLALPAVALSDNRLAADTWPGRFDADDHTDLVGVDPATGNLLVLIGNGDGTFGTRIPSTVQGRPVAVRDIDGDGFSDVVAVSSESGEGGDMTVLRSNGDGSFEIAAAMPGAYMLVLIEDFDDDGRRDLAAAMEPGSLHLFRGLGEFAFAPPLAYDTDPGPFGGMTAADFNGDTLPDIALTTHIDVDLFLNNGGLLFGRSVIDVAPILTDVTARDLNGDAAMDLVVSTRNGPSPAQGVWDTGDVHVFAGNGDGTFEPPAIYSTAPGAYSVVIGDFTRDGTLDIATANMSALQVDDFCALYKTVDSVSVLPGNGNGTFGPHTSFSLSSARDALYRTAILQNAVVSLNTNDLNADGHTDLIASHGVVLLNEAPRANRPPTADAGPDQSAANPGITLRGDGGDPDGHWLRFEWSFGTNEPDGRSIPTFCYEGESDVFTLTVDDGQGGRASDSMTFTLEPDVFVTVIAPAAGNVFSLGEPITIRWDAFNDFPLHHFAIAVSPDGVNYTYLHREVPAGEREFTWTNAGPASETTHVRMEALDVNNTVLAVGISDPFAIRAAAPGSLPFPWVSEDIGAVGAAGSASFANGTFTVRGSGADIWDTADEFHFVSRSGGGDPQVFELIARVGSVQNVNRWTKAGLMVRANKDPGAGHASLFVTPTTEKGVAFQRRRADGTTSIHTAGPALTAPIWLKLAFDQGHISAYYRTDMGPWILIGEDNLVMTGPTVVGLAVSSHVDGTLATATFSDVTFTDADAPIPEPWVCGDVGAVGTRGACRGIDGEDFKQIEVDGSGDDIWSTADEFSFARQEVDGDFAFTARVNSVENVNRWTKAGLMIRDFGSGSAGSRHASLFVTPTTERGTAFQRRPSAGGVSVHTAGPVTTAPIWLRLVRTGDVIRAFYRKQTTDPWTPVGEQQFTGLPSRLSAMLVVSSHVDGTLATANFESVVIDPLEPMQSIDIGTTAPGSTQTNGTTTTIDGDGADIWGAADGFRFHYAQWTGDGTIIARVRSLENTNAWAKAGVMIREGLQPGSRHVFALVSAGKGVSLQHRSGVGGITAEAARTVGTAPVWVRLTREGNRIAAFYTTAPEVSPDGHLYTWESLGEVTIGMTAEVFVGLAVTSHASGTLATAVFDDMLIGRP